MAATRRPAETLTVRAGGVADLAGSNAVIEQAVRTWNLPERVVRLALPSYRYREHDLEFLELLVAEDAVHGIVGVAGIEPADPADCPAGSRALLLHSLYVRPDRQRAGIGRQLLDAVAAAARERGYSGLLVKAQADSAGFFAAQGWEHLPVGNGTRDYPYRYWRPTPPADTRHALADTGP